MSEKKFRFNIIDAVIVLVLIAAVAVLGYVFIISDDTEVKGETHTVEYVIEVTSLNSMFADSVVEGDHVTFENNRDLDLGTVSAPPQVKTSIKTGFDAEKEEEVYAEAEGLIDMIITFRATTVETEWGYCIDDEAYIAVNNSNDFIIGDLRCVGVCTDVTVID